MSSEPPAQGRAEVARLVEDVTRGSHPAAARVISLAEEGAPEGREALRLLHARSGRAYVVGVTGPPGAGKSSLVDLLTRHLRDQGRTVGIVAVDPTSPYTGGAILGDRIRMMDHSTDPGVFVRSMATRGSLGGLAPATADAVRVLDAMGSAVIFVETVGAGQAEVDVVETADTVIVVTVPGLGDAVQTMKAGIMEIADVFAVNKADLPDANRAAAQIEMMLHLSPNSAWQPPVVKTSATQRSGIGDLWAAVERHRAHLEESGDLRRRRLARVRAEILRLVERGVRSRVEREAEASGSLDDLVARTAAGDLDPHEAAQALLESVK